MRRGRPTIGGTPREKRVTVRLTAQEEEALTRLHGTPGKGIRFLVAAMMRAEGKTPPLPPKKTRASSSDASASPGGEENGNLERVQFEVTGDTTLPPKEEAERHSNTKTEVLKAVAAGTHRHKPVGEPIRVEYVQGIEKKVYACACGKEMKR